MPKRNVEVEIVRGGSGVYVNTRSQNKVGSRCNPAAEGVWGGGGFTLLHRKKNFFSEA